MVAVPHRPVLRPVGARRQGRPGAALQLQPVPAESRRSLDRAARPGSDLPRHVLLVRRGNGGGIRHAGGRGLHLLAVEHRAWRRRQPLQLQQQPPARSPHPGPGQLRQSGQRLPEPTGSGEQ